MGDFVSFEIAKKLKEKGFRWLCLAYYTNDDTLYCNYSHKSGASYTDCYLSHNLMPKDSVSGKFVDAPTISQVLKWLREEKKICIEINCNYTDYFPTVRLLDYHQTDYIRGDVVYDSYEDCAIAGIEYVLDNLI